MKNDNTLTSYPFTDEDINLITFALRKLADNTGFGNLKNEATELIAYIEREKTNKN